MSFSYDNFIRPLTGSDRVLKIYGDDGIVVYTINPYSVKSISVYANNIRVSLHSDKVIVISFSSNNEAGLSIGKLRTALDVLQNKQPLFISKEIEEYVKNNVFGPTGSTGPTGATGSTGIQGPQGDDGRSAYEVWTDNGNVGSETTFFDSLKGTSGTSGFDGSSGTSGHLEQKVQVVHQVHQDHRVLQEHLDHLELRVVVVLQEHLDHLELRVVVVLLEHLLM